MGADAKNAPVKTAIEQGEQSEAERFKQQLMDKSKQPKTLDGMNIGQWKQAFTRLQKQFNAQRRNLSALQALLAHAYTAGYTDGTKERDGELSEDGAHDFLNPEE